MNITKEIREVLNRPVSAKEINLRSTASRVGPTTDVIRIEDAIVILANAIDDIANTYKVTK